MSLAYRTVSILKADHQRLTALADGHGAKLGTMFTACLNAWGMLTPAQQLAALRGRTVPDEVAGACGTGEGQGRTTLDASADAVSVATR